VITRAADAIGGAEELSRRLGYSSVMVRAWMAGTVKVPEDVFFKAVAILHGEDPQPHKDRAGEAPGDSFDTE
jgi:hypothetical protein